MEGLERAGLAQAYLVRPKLLMAFWWVLNDGPSVGVHSERTTRQAWGIFFMAIGHEGWKVVSDALTELSESEARSFVHKLITRGQSGWYVFVFKTHVDYRLMFVTGLQV